MSRWLLLAIVVLVGGARAERRPVIDVTKVEGLMLQQINAESNSNKRLEYLEYFLVQFPKDPSIPWVLEQLRDAYKELGNQEKALALTQRLMEIDAWDIEAAYASLKLIEAEKNAEKTRQAALQTSDVARRVLAGPRPAHVPAEEWPSRVDLARQVDHYCDYLLYTQALQIADPRARMRQLEAFEKRSPQSPYAAQLQQYYYQLRAQSGDKAGALAMAEKLADQGKADEDMLLQLANHYFEADRDRLKVVKYAMKARDLLLSKPRPAGVSEGEWQRQKSTKLGLAAWMAGITYSYLLNLAEADRLLRESLPNIRNAPHLTAEAYFHLGLVNFKIGEKTGDVGRLNEAVKFNEACATIPGQFREQAQRNIESIRAHFKLQ